MKIELYVWQQSNHEQRVVQGREKVRIERVHVRTQGRGPGESGVALGAIAALLSCGCERQPGGLVLPIQPKLKASHEPAILLAQWQPIQPPQYDTSLRQLWLVAAFS